MNTSAKPRSMPNDFELPGRMNLIVALLAFVPMMIVIFILLALAVEPLQIPLVVLLFVVGACCAMLCYEALKIMLGGAMQVGDDALVVKRFLSEDVYPWATIEDCKVMPATGTLGDDPLSEASERIGLGLFLRNTERQREHDLDADIILCAGHKDDARNLIRLSQKVVLGLKRHHDGLKRPQARAKPTQQRRYRKRAKSASTSAVVSNIRNGVRNA